LKLAIVGGGISGLSLAFFLQNDFEITIFEKEKWGGKAYTQRVGNYLFEEGVNGFLDKEPIVLELCEKIGIKPIKANENSKKRFIYDEKIKEIPLKPQEFLFSDLMSLKGKIRILGDFFIKPKCEEESVKDFAIRRFGYEFYEKMMIPMLAGIYASTPEITSMNASFPRLKEIECKYGSLFKGMMALKKGGQPSGELTSFEYGMSEFIDKLKESTKANFIKKEIKSIDELKEFDKVVIATPAFSAAKILGGKISELLNKISYNPVAIVGFDFDEIKPIGFGILTIKEKALGILMDKYIFPNRNGIRVMLGGARYPEIKDLSEKEIITLAKKEVEKITGAKNPKIEWIKLHKKAIPNYSLNHQKLVDEIFREAKKLGIYITGNAYKGVSFNDCVKNSFKLAQKIKVENG